MERVKALLRERNVGCTLKKQSPHLTAFFFARLKEYSLNSDRDLRERLWQLLRFIGKPNEEWRKDDLITKTWPDLERDLKS